MMTKRFSILILLKVEAALVGPLGKISWQYSDDDNNDDDGVVDEEALHHPPWKVEAHLVGNLPGWVPLVRRRQLPDPCKPGFKPSSFGSLSYGVSLKKVLFRNDYAHYLTRSLGATGLNLASHSVVWPGTDWSIGHVHDNFLFVAKLFCSWVKWFCRT